MASSPPESAAPPPSRRSLGARGAVFLLTLAVASLLIDWPRLEHSIALDPSWQRLFDAQFAARTQVGPESIFTYGPLGALHTQAWGPNAFWWRALLVEGLFKLVLGLFVTRALLAVPGRALRVLAFVALFTVGLTDDSGIQFGLAATGVVLVASPSARAFELLGAAFVLALAGALKFTFQLEGCAVATLVTFVLWSRGERRRSLQWVASFVAVQFGIWLAAGQELANLPSYLRGSLEIARGYTLAQGSGPLLVDFLQPAAVFGFASLSVAARVRAARADARVVGVGALSLLGLALAFRAAAISTPLPTTFHELALVLPFLALAVPQGSDEWRPGWKKLSGLLAVLAATCAVPNSFVAVQTAELGVVALVRARLKDVTGGLVGFTELAERRRELEEGDLLARERYAMPRTVAFARGRAVDVVGVEQALAIFNDLPLRGRPVAQSYSVHTAWLAERNVHALRTESGPEIVLLRVANHERLAGWMLEPHTFETVLERFEPRFLEWDYLVLERSREPVVERESWLALEREIAAGEWLELPTGEERGLWIELDTRLSPLGTLYAALVRGPLPVLELEFESGLTRLREFAPQVARGGWRIEPWIETQHDLASWLAGEELPRVRRLRWLLPVGGEALVEALAHLRCVHRAPPRCGPRLSRSELHPWASRVPDRVESSGGRWSVLTEAGPALRARAPLQFEWQLPAGKHAWHARGALVRESGASGAPATTLSVKVRENGVERRLEEHGLEAPAGAGHSRRFRLRGEFELAAPSVLELEFQGATPGVIVGEHVQLDSIGPREAQEPSAGEPRVRRRERGKER